MPPDNHCDSSPSDSYVFGSFRTDHNVVPIILKYLIRLQVKNALKMILLDDNGLM